LVGAAILMVADEGFKEFQDWRALGMGLLLPLFVVLLPGGLTGLFDRGRSKSAAANKMRAVPPPSNSSLKSTGAGIVRHPPHG
jgi:hypothetical protein